MAILAFGAFELDETSLELSRQGRRVHLAAQPARVLALLAGRPGEIVTRDELRRHVWGVETFVAFDAGLNFCIAAVRAALNDSARSPRFIETLPKQGYRFLADVRVVDSQAPSSAASPRIHARTWPRRLRQWTSMAAVAILFLQGPVRERRAHTRETADPAAIAAFDRGMAAWSDGSAGIRRSLVAFREAARRDPRFAEAHYALAETYATLAERRELGADAALTEAQAAALRAVALEDVRASRQLLGALRLWRDWDWTGARRDFTRAVLLEPQSDSALVSYARFLSAAGDDDGALAAIDRAELLNPTCDLLLWESAEVRYRARKHDEALAKLALAEEFGPPGTMPHGEWRSRIAWLRRLVHAARDPNPISVRFDDPRMRPRDRATPPALSGDAETAIAWLERAAADRDPSFIYALRNPVFDLARGDARFRSLENRVRRGSAPRILDPAMIAVGLFRIAK